MKCSICGKTKKPLFSEEGYPHLYCNYCMAQIIFGNIKPLPVKKKEKV